MAYMHAANGFCCYQWLMQLCSYYWLVIIMHA